MSRLLSKASIRMHSIALTLKMDETYSKGWIHSLRGGRTLHSLFLWAVWRNHLTLCVGDFCHAFWKDNILQTTELCKCPSHKATQGFCTWLRIEGASECSRYYYYYFLQLRIIPIHYMLDPSCAALAPLPFVNNTVFSTGPRNPCSQTLTPWFCGSPLPDVCNAVYSVLECGFIFHQEHFRSWNRSID